MAPAEEAPLDRLEPVLPAPYRLVGGETVFQEVEGSARLEHPPDFPQGGADVGNGAERERREGGVATAVRQGQRLAVEALPLDRDLRSRQPLAGQLPARVGRLDRGDAA